MIAASLGSQTSNYIFWFRQEQLKTLNWGGDPEEIKEEKGDFDVIQPRKSFNLWRQEVQGYSGKMVAQ